MMLLIEISAKMAPQVNCIPFHIIRLKTYILLDSISSDPVTMNYKGVKSDFYTHLPIDGIFLLFQKNWFLNLKNMHAG